MTEIKVTDPAVEAAERAYVDLWRDRRRSPGAGMRAALEAAAPLLQVQVDHEALTEALLAKWLYLSETKEAAAPVEHCRSLADAVLDLLSAPPCQHGEYYADADDAGRARCADCNRPYPSSALLSPEETK